MFNVIYKPKANNTNKHIYQYQKWPKHISIVKIIVRLMKCVRVQVLCSTVSWKYSLLPVLLQCIWYHLGRIHVKLIQFSNSILVGTFLIRTETYALYAKHEYCNFMRNVILLIHVGFYRHYDVFDNIPDMCYSDVEPTKTALLLLFISPLAETYAPLKSMELFITSILRCYIHNTTITKFILR